MERYIHTIEHYLAIKKEQTMNTCKNMDESQKCYIEGKKSEAFILCQVLRYVKFI